MPLAIIVAGMMSGCGGTTNEVITSPRIEQYRIVRIAVLPFTVTPKTLGQGRGYAEPAPPPVAAEKLAELFYLKLNAREGDRKSTRLNSSHGYISYAVFCLKKKIEDAETGARISGRVMKI